MAYLNSKAKSSYIAKSRVYWTWSQDKMTTTFPVVDEKRAKNIKLYKTII